MPKKKGIIEKPEREPKKSEVRYAADSLTNLKEQLDRITAWLDKHKWENASPENAFDSFKLHKEVTDALDKWLRSYEEQIGLIDYYNKQQAAQKEQKLRGGSVDYGACEEIDNIKEEENEEYDEE
jgi:hypothetical protein